MRLVDIYRYIYYNGLYGNSPVDISEIKKRAEWDIKTEKLSIEIYHIVSRERGAMSVKD